MDHLLFEAYKQLFVLSDGEQNKILLEELRHEWDSQVREGKGEMWRRKTKLPTMCVSRTAV